MAAYFSYRGMGPFGNSTLLTVDLGQQYVDFFCLFSPYPAQSSQRLILHVSKSARWRNVWRVDLLSHESL
ncbi:YfhO family protein [Secundilactobacillus silagei]|uniref:YfhO family protein n=1 Tax=Secundilactobacillus silagei TaxID=1293415 RepID=UPI0034E2CDFB